METRKTKKADLSQRRGVYFNLGLVLAMAFVISAFEYKSYGDIERFELPEITDVYIPIINVPRTNHDIPKAPKPKPIKIVNPIIVDDLTKEFVEYKDVLAPKKEVPIETSVVYTIPEEKAEELPFTIVEKMPEPIGGELAFLKYLAREIKYPSHARRMGIEGMVFVEFIIDETGALTDVHTIKGIGAGCDEEAERVLRNAPKWNPGKQRGIPVKVKMVLPISFQLGR